MKKNKISILASSLLLSGAFTFANAGYVYDLEYTAENPLNVTVIQRGGVLYSNSYPTEEDILFNNAIINVTVDDSANNLSFVNKRFYILLNETSINIEGDLSISDNSALLDFYYSLHNDSALSLTAIGAQTVDDAVVTVNADNKNGKKAASVFQRIIDSGDYGEMNNVIQKGLYTLSTNEEVAKAVDSTTPQTTTASFTAATQISNNVSNIITQRQNINLNSSGINSGDEMLSEKNVWVKTYGSYGEQDDKDGLNGFDIKTYGLGFGFDGEYADNQKVGIGFFYTNADVDVNHVSQSSDMDVYSLIVYGNVPVIDEKTNFLYQVGYSWQRTDTTRNIEFMNKTAKADYTSKIASLDLKLLRDYKINEDLLLQPFVSTTYRHFKTPSYSESGAEALNLNVSKFTSSELIVGLGTLAYYEIDEDSKLTGSVNLGYDLRDDNNIVSSSYHGASGLSYDTEGIDNGRVSYDLGVGYETDFNELSNLSFNYNFQGEGSDYLNHVLSLKYTYRF
jgi:outer membrane autotransporter protein